MDRIDAAINLLTAGNVTDALKLFRDEREARVPQLASDADLKVALYVAQYCDRMFDLALRRR